MKLREAGAKIILGAMAAPLVVTFIAWAGLEIVEAANSIGVLEVRIDNVEQKEERIYRELRKLNEKFDKLLERE